MGLWLNLKRDKHYASVYYNGVHILDIKVDEQNRGNIAFINLDASKEVTFKVVKEKIVHDDNYGNKEEFNR
jgi:hypothetical protein